MPKYRLGFSAVQVEEPDDSPWGGRSLTSGYVRVFIEADSPQHALVRLGEILTHVAANGVPIETLNPPITVHERLVTQDDS